MVLFGFDEYFVIISHADRPQIHLLILLRVEHLHQSRRSQIASLVAIAVGDKP